MEKTFKKENLFQGEKDSSGRNKAVYMATLVAGGWALGRGSNELGRGSNELGRGSNDLGRGSNELGRGSDGRSLTKKCDGPADRRSEL